MIRDNQHKLNTLRVILDLITIVASYFLTFLLFFYVIPESSAFGGAIHVSLRVNDYLMMVVFIAPLHLLVYAMAHLYATMRITGRRKELVRVFRSNLISIVILGMFFWLFIKTDKMMIFSRMFLFEFLIINTMGIVLQRNLLRMAVVRFRKHAVNKRSILLVGWSKSCEALLDRIRMNARWGYEVSGVLADDRKAGYESS